MRSTTKKATYIASQGLVNYFEYKIVGFEKTTDQQAKVTVKFTSEVPEMEINGKTYSVPKKETEIVQDWIWVDGSWYMLFKDLMGNNFREL
jgi:L-2-hydroxyglutarate oxidase LhgO